MANGRPPALRTPASIPTTAPDTMDERDATTPPPATPVAPVTSPTPPTARRVLTPAQTTAMAARRRMAPRR